MSRRKRQYPARVPRFAAGIRLQETRGQLARSWWVRRWLASLEAMNLGARAGRGRSYAASGQVIALSLGGSHVEARVVGSRPEPYVMTLDFRVPQGPARARIVAQIRQEPILVGRLLAADLPTEIEGFFRAEGLTLFPGGKLGPHQYDMTVACSCPDYVKPCKHSLAVLFLLGEEIARRPLTLLELRGISEQELIHED